MIPPVAFILPGILILFWILWYGGMWYFRVKRPRGMMMALADRLGGHFSAGLVSRVSRRIPQFESAQLRLAREAYNVIELTRPIRGEACTIWLGHAGNQFGNDPLIKAVGGEIHAGFIAVVLPASLTGDAVVSDRLLRRAELRRLLPYGRRRGGVIVWEMLQEWSERRGLIPGITGDAAFDDRFRVHAVNEEVVTRIVGSSVRRLWLNRSPGNIWIMERTLLLEAGDTQWSTEMFVRRLEFIQELVSSWDA